MKNATGTENPRGRGREKRIEAMRWLNRWGYTTPAILSELTGIDRTAGPRLAAQLIKRDLVREVAAGGNWGYWRYGINSSTGKREAQGPYLLLLTEVGKTTAVSLDSTVGAPWERQVAGIQSIRHNLIAQRFTIELLTKGGFSDYLPEPTTRAASQNGIKEPDVVVTNAEGKRVAVEIELTPKSTQTGALDRALQAVAYALRRRSFDQCIYVFGSDHFRQQYERTWHAGKLAEWEKNGSKWEPTGQATPISDDVIVRCGFTQSDFLLGDIS